MENHYKGIHHITALAGDPNRNAEFYVKKLGMRLVKKSVNQDDPSTYHLFYGNATGSPGSGLTFFPWPMAVQGKPGLGEAVTVSLTVPEGSQEFWAERFGEQDIDFDGPFDQFGHQVMRFKDPDRMQLELVFDEKAAELPGWSESTVPEEHTIRGFWGTTLRLKQYNPTAKILNELFGFEKTAEDGDRYLYTTDAPIGRAVIIEKGESRPSSNGRGIIHHVAFRIRDKEEQEELRQKVIEMGLQPSQVIDRHWFHSVYFREPGGVLFEIATEGPGYDVDEDPDKLGEKLILPPWLEAKREMIEKRLPEIKV
ncbi:ring-cleaving dioxygenase [Aliifodinibius sp. S!AR15-10]|uniref:ring-cleaving dioxygenase n=1 Tax=Aliifodinibius sp. S!AR15-10 TaxID=2950437 RepID=UPI002864A0B6|nr:ring-cleaving dioxygenase [Aliifodinibius sp. S!AR15-10]MDR8391536.1 ring-cleaving dioxygenase [Aliifodinibius sp. S!AR15-10]